MNKQQYAYLLFKADSIERAKKNAEARGGTDYVPSHTTVPIDRGLEAMALHEGDTHTTLTIKGTPGTKELMDGEARLFFGSDVEGQELRKDPTALVRTYKGPRRRG